MPARGSGGKYVPAKKGRPDGVVKTVSGQPRFGVKAAAADMYAASTSGCSSRSTLIATKSRFIASAVASSANDSRAMTWHQWHVEYPIETRTGTFRRSASANADSPHGYQATGLPAC